MGTPSKDRQRDAATSYFSTNDTLLTESKDTDENPFSINLIQFTGLKIIFRLELIKTSRQNYFFSDVIHISIMSNLDKSHPPLPLLSPSSPPPLPLLSPSSPPSPSPFYKTRILTMLLLYMRPRNSSWQEKWSSGNTCKFVHTSITSVHGLTFIPTEIVKVIKLRLACLLTSELTSRIHMKQWFDTMQDYINFVLTERKGYTLEYWREVVAVEKPPKTNISQ